MNPVYKSEKLKWEFYYFIVETFWYIMFLDSALKASVFAEGPHLYSVCAHHTAALSENCQFEHLLYSRYLLLYFQTYDLFQFLHHF